MAAIADDCDILGLLEIFQLFVDSAKVGGDINHFREALFTKLQHNHQVPARMEIFVIKDRAKEESKEIALE